MLRLSSFAGNGGERSTGDVPRCSNKRWERLSAWTSPSGPSLCCVYSLRGSQVTGCKLKMNSLTGTAMKLPCMYSEKAFLIAGSVVRRTFSLLKRGRGQRCPNPEPGAGDTANWTWQGVPPRHPQHATRPKQFDCFHIYVQPALSVFRHVPECPVLFQVSVVFLFVNSFERMDRSCRFRFVYA